MNQEIKKRWLENLRSGKFKQTDGVLCAVDENKDLSFCCLGVLCETMGVERSFKRGVPVTPDRMIYDGDSYSLLPEKVVKSSELTNNEGQLSSAHLSTVLNWIEKDPDLSDGKKEDIRLRAQYSYLTLAWLNDQGVSFQTIANIIESCL